MLEEAHEFIPQSTGTPLKQMLTRIALRGRKRGLGIILMSQRSAKVEKDVLTQTSLLILHKVMHPTDLRVYKDLIPLPATQVEDMVRRLNPGEAVVVYNHQVSVVQLRLRTTFHAGSTPTLSRTTQPKLRKLDTAMLRELRALTTVADKTARIGNEQTKLAQKVKELEEAIALKDAEIQRLQGQVELLGKLSVSIEGMSNIPRFQDADTLKVAQAIVGEVVTSEKNREAKSKGTDSSTFYADTSIIHYTAQVTGDLTPAEQRKLDSIVQRIQKLPRLQKSILRLLFEHEGTAMTVPTIATWLSVKENTIRGKPPKDLLNMKFIVRTRTKSGYKYMSLMHSYLSKEFPSISPTVLMKQFFK